MGRAVLAIRRDSRHPGLALEWVSEGVLPPAPRFDSDLGTGIPGTGIHPLCTSFAQVSLRVIVRLKTSLPGALSGSSAK